jgi:diguanylate cyclase (GGDEF)-like protein/PAS domain S-box-containing protein
MRRPAACDLSATTCSTIADGRTPTRQDADAAVPCPVANVSCTSVFADFGHGSDEPFDLQRVATALIDGVGDMLALLTTDGTFAFASAAALSVVGWAPDLLRGRSAYELVHPADREALADAHGHTLQHDVTNTVSYRMLRGDGGYSWVETSVQAAEDPIGGELAGLHCVIRDVSARLEREQQLADRSAAVEHAAEGIAIIADDGRYLSLNTAHAELLGVSVAGALLQPWSATLDVASWARVERALAEATEGARTTVDCRTPEPEARDLRLGLTRRRPDGWFACSRDITAEREAERALQASEQRWRAVARSIPDIAVLVVDRDLRCVAADGQALVRAGWDPKKLVGQVIDEAVDGPRGEHLRQLYEGALDGASQEEEHRSTEGRWYSTRYVPLAGEDGTVLAAMAVATDITHHRDHEAHLLHLAEHDPLTSLANRRSFERSLREHVARCARYGREGAVVLIDLDRFKQVNDQLGHAAGDELLTAVATAFAERLRTTDVVARLGGDEFVLLLPKGDATEVTIVARDLDVIVRDIGAAYPLAADSVSASIGAVVLADVDIALEPQALLAAADMAMYRAKASGRDGVELA